MTDPELVEKKLAFIETCVAELRTLAHPEQLHDDVREARFVQHTLQLAVQAALDVASHIVSDERLGEPRTNRELFELLETRWTLPKELAETLGRMVGFRNIVVHGYEAVDLDIVSDIVAHRLDHLLSFVAFVRSRLQNGRA
ncbi:MAG: DUF86 domain-containing protein [Luteitalea sp.]|nr:DUF86 domain-containing protein [Luteitalea sp.]